MIDKAADKEKEHDVILVIGELFFDHPLSGPAILKRLLEKNGYNVGIIELPQKESDVKKLGEPKLFFGITSGSIDSMVRNYTPLKKSRKEDPHNKDRKNEKYNEPHGDDYSESPYVHEKIPDRAVVVYSNWIKRNFKDSVIVIGGTEASLRRFTHYDYWQNRLRKSIMFDTRADILVYGNGEKQILEIADRIKREASIKDIEGTCLIAKEIPEIPKGQQFTELPSHEEVEKSKEKFCEMQNLLSNRKNLAQKTGDRYIIQYKSPLYTSKDLDEYYELPFTREIPSKHKELRGFEFSIVTHRGCIGNCNFCSLVLTSGDRIISRSEESILREIKNMTKLSCFRGNIDDLGGPSANMYGMHCNDCSNDCLQCKKLDRSNKRLIELLKKARKVNGVKNVYIRSGIRYDLATPEYLKELIQYHIFDTLRIAPEHVSKEVLDFMNKNYGNLDEFIKEFDKIRKEAKSSKELSFYFMTAHPGSSMKEAKELADAIKMKGLKNCESVQVFTPTPMTVSTCMYYTGLEPKTKKKVHVPYTYSEKKEQKRAVMKNIKK